MRKFSLVLAVAAVVGLVGTAQAQPATPFEGTKEFKATIEPATARPGETVLFRLVIETKPGFHTYPIKQIPEAEVPIVTEINFSDKKGNSLDVIVPVGATVETAKTELHDVPKVGKLLFIEGKAMWERPLVVRPDAKSGPKSIKVRTEIQACDDKGCKPGPRYIEVPFTVSNEPPVVVDAKYDADVRKAIGASVPVRIPGTKPEPKDDAKPKEKSEPKPEAVVAPADEPDEGSAGLRANLEGIVPQLTAAPAPPTDLLSFILSGIFWGGVSLVTPCVFPMIPITVSFFLKQSDKEHHRPIAMAVVYCTTIVVVLTLAAILLLSVFRELSVNPITNYVIGGLFIFFALSLFGMFEIELPSFMTRYTSSHEGQGGFAGTVFMALTFTIVSFSCVAPFLGGFGGTSATSTMTWPQRIFGGLAFSMTFASPFFVLALFPSLLKKMPKSGSWLNSVKVVMGFLEIAAALKFFRTAEVRMNTGFFTYDWVLGLYIALALLCGLYLLGLYRLPHDTPNEHLGVPRMLLAMAFLAMAIYLIPGLFRGAGGEKQRPAGVLFAWIDSFLLPEEEPKKGDLAWSGNLPRAIADARKQRKETGKPQYVFIDFTGKTCVNCIINERDVFPREEIQQAFRPFHLVKMFTDEVPAKLYPPNLRDRIDKARQDEDAAANAWFQQAAFKGNEQLPLYVILEPMLDNQIKITAQYTEGKINDPKAFAAFLRKPWEVDTTAQAKAE